MKKIEFIRQLRATAEAMAPLTETGASNAAVWNGEQYVKEQAKHFDPSALAWWSTLNAIAALLEAQDSSLTKAQLDYLGQTLFGGMGSLNDIYFDSKALGPLADTVNDTLNQRRRELYDVFREPD